MLDLPDALQVGNIVKSSKIDKINGNGEAIFNLGENVRGVLNSFQMSDHPEHSDALFGKLKAGDAVENMLVLDTCKIFTRGGLPSWKIVLSVKPALIAALENGKLPKSLDDAEVDDIFCGYVHNTTAHGAFLRFLGRSTAYVPKANISDRFVVSPSDFVHRGQTMWVKIVRPSSNPGESPIGTVRPSQCCPWNVPHEEQNLYLRTLLEEDEATAEQNTAQKDDSEDEGEETGHWSDFTVGMVVKGMVLKQSAKGFLLKIDGGMAGFCINANAPKNEYAKGAQCKCLVLNIDKENVSTSPTYLQ
jgi:ribosomal protein S1